MTTSVQNSTVARDTSLFDADPRAEQRELPTLPGSAQVAALSTEIAKLADGLVTYTVESTDSCCDDHVAGDLGDRVFPVDLDSATGVTAAGWTSTHIDVDSPLSHTPVAWVAGRLLAGTRWVSDVLSGNYQGLTLETVTGWLADRVTPDRDLLLDALAAQIVMDGWALPDGVTAAAHEYGVSVGASADPEDQVTLFVENFGEVESTRVSLTRLTLEEARALADAALTAASTVTVTASVTACVTDPEEAAAA